MAAELKIGIGADNSGLKQGLQDAEAQISAFVSKVGKIGQIGEQLSSIGQKMSVGLTLPILALGGSAIKAYGDIQSLQKGLEAVMGSGAAAAKEFERLKEVSKLPGLGMEEAVRGSINLQAIGMDANRSRKILQEFGNAVATVGRGRAEFERAIYGVQQLANTDFPLGEDLNIIKDALPQVAGLLNDAFGTANTEKIREAGVTSKQVLETITAGLEKLPRVTGGINGAFENLGDSMKTSLARIGKIIDDTFDISGIIDKLTGYLDTAISYFEGLSPAIQKTILVVTGLAAAAGPLLVVVGGFIAALPTIISGLGALKIGFTALTGPIGLVTSGIAGIIALVVANWSKITPYLVRTANNFIQLYNESQTFRGGVLSIGFAFESLYAVIKSFAISAYNALKSFGKGALNLFEGLSLVIRGAFNMDADMISMGWRKANEKVALSFDDLGARIGALESKYNRLLKNDKPLKYVTEADLNINSEKVSKDAEESIVSGITKGVGKAKDKVGITLLDFGKSFSQNLAGFSVSNPLDSLFTEEQVKAFEDRMAEYTPRLIVPLTNAQTAMQEQGIRFQEAVEGLINEGVVEGLSQAFEAMGGAITQGGNILQAAGGAILGVLGQFMQMLGKEMIKLAVSTIALGNLVKGIKKWIISNPGAAIALAGVAIAAGALLSAAGSNIGGGSSVGGGSVPSGGGNTSQSYSSSFSSGSTGGEGRVVFEISGNSLIGVLDRSRERNTRLGG